MGKKKKKPVKPKRLWVEESEAATKPGAKKCTYCRFYKCRCPKGVE